MMRRYVFKLYPSKSQADALDRHRRMHCALYNALLQQRIEAYARCVDHVTGKGKTLSFYDQSKQITLLRKDDADYDALSSDSLAATAQRVDNAFKAFFRRAKAGAGASSGFPRFKSSKHYPGFDFRYGRGCKLILDVNKALQALNGG